MTHFIERFKIIFFFLYFSQKLKIEEVSFFSNDHTRNMTSYSYELCKFVIENYSFQIKNKKSEANVLYSNEIICDRSCLI
jgi:hypothetical protein